MNEHEFSEARPSDAERVSERIKQGQAVYLCDLVSAAAEHEAGGDYLGAASLHGRWMEDLRHAILTGELKVFDGEIERAYRPSDELDLGKGLVRVLPGSVKAWRSAVGRPEWALLRAVPATSASTTGPIHSEPQRRLAALRALGGDVTRSGRDWSITGIAALEAKERAEGYGRSSQKTIRADLKKAAEDESNAKRAGESTASWHPR